MGRISQQEMRAISYMSQYFDTTGNMGLGMNWRESV